MLNEFVSANDIAFYTQNVFLFHCHDEKLLLQALKYWVADDVSTCLRIITAHVYYHNHNPLTTWNSSRLELQVTVLAY